MPGICIGSTDCAESVQSRAQRVNNDTPMIDLALGTGPVIVKNYIDDTGGIIIGAIGVALACVSLGWQAWTFVRSGSRAELVLVRGMFQPTPRGMTPGILSSFKAGEMKPLKLSREPTATGALMEVLIATVRNTGRLPTTVAHVQMTVEYVGGIESTTTPPMRPSPLATHDLPFRLEAESHGNWLFPLHNAHAGRAPGTTIEATVSVLLATGRTLRKKVKLPVPDVGEDASTPSESGNDTERVGSTD